MIEVSWAVALVAGALSLLSPCSALLLPSFFAYAFASRRRLIARTAVFALGLMAVLVPLGLGVRSVVGAVTEHRGIVIQVAGWLLIGLGVLTALGRGVLPWARPIQQRTAHFGTTARAGGLASWFATAGLGAVYGVAGFCAGPALGAILTLAATTGTAAEGGVLLALYALGMSVPLFLLALLWERLDLGSRSFVRGRIIEIPLGRWRIPLHTTSVLSGALFIAVGVLFLVYDGGASLQTLTRIDLSSLQLGAQQWVMNSLGAIPWWTLPAAIALGALTVAWRRAR